MKRFDIITEADARQLEPGTTVELSPRGHVTPLARDTLRARRITVLHAESHTPDLADLVPAFPVRTVAIASDHTGIALRQDLVRHLRASGLQVTDLGTDGPGAVDYPDVAASVAILVARGQVDAGIVIDGAGIGSAIAANKVPGVRAAMCLDPMLARYAREHNGSNVLTLGASLVDGPRAREIVDVWLHTGMHEPRYVRRLGRIRVLEQERR